MFILRILHMSSPKVLGMRGCIGKNLNHTLTRDSVGIEYITGEQPLPYELAFWVKLGQIYILI